MNIKFRIAKKEDGPAIAKILAEAYVSLDSSLENALKAYQSERKRGYYYVLAEKGDEIVGLSAWFYHGLPKHGLIEIDRFAVSSRCRKQGIGTQIFKFLVKDANRYFEHFGGLRKIFLFTRAENHAAHKFYESLGFVREGKVKKHFYDHKDDLIYSYYMK